MDKERLDKQIDFILELDKEKSITRKNFLANASRRENDAEHAWHLAVSALILSEYANEKIDVLKTIAMVLMHDVVEIDAGDTYAFDEEGARTQAEREARAADRLYHILPDDQAEKYLNLWLEFEEGETPEARFAHTLDNFQPAMLNDASGGLSWAENNIKMSQILKRNAHTHEGSEVLWEYQKNFFRKNMEKGNIIKDADEL